MYSSDKKTEYTRGFSITEALVSFAILVISLTAFLSATTVSMKTFRYSEESNLASKLAKEGLELVISKKDNHVTCFRRGDCDNWRNNLEDGDYEISSARPEELLPDGALKGFGAPPVGERFLCLIRGGEGMKGKFGYCTGPGESEAGPFVDGEGDFLPARFTRKITIESLGDGLSSNSPDGIRVLSTVEWDGGEVVLETQLYLHVEEI